MPKPRERVEYLIKKWIHVLGMRDWVVHVSLAAEAHSDDLEDGISIKADIAAEPIYMTAELNVYPAFFEQRPKDQEETIVHELVHCLIAPERDLLDELRDGKLVTPGEAERVNESVVQKLTKVFLRLNKGK